MHYDSRSDALSICCRFRVPPLQNRGDQSIGRGNHIREGRTLLCPNPSSYHSLPHLRTYPNQTHPRYPSQIAPVPPVPLVRWHPRTQSALVRDRIYRYPRLGRCPLRATTIRLVVSFGNITPSLVRWRQRRKNRGIMGDRRGCMRHRQRSCLIDSPG